jgi:proline iminopeptidase
MIPTLTTRNAMKLTRREALAALAATPFAVRTIAQTSPAAVADASGYAAVPGGRVWWRRIGSGPKTPILLLHGGPGAGHDYLLGMRALADERPVIFYDQLGCGRSDAPEDESIYRIPRFVSEVDALRSALNLERVHLFGHSWGSMLAIEYLVTGHGRGVEKLILGGALASIPQAVAGMRRLLEALPNGAGRKLKDLEAAAKQDSEEYQQLVTLFYDRHLCRLNPKPPEFDATIANLSKSPAYRIMNGPNEFTIVGNMKDWERRQDLGAIKLPTLITTGEFDEVTIDCAKTIRNGIKGSRLTVMPGCSHLTMLEKPGEYNAIIRRFLA